MSYAFHPFWLLSPLPFTLKLLHTMYNCRTASVSRSEAKAHGLIMRALEPTISEQSVSFGYVRTQRTGLTKMFTMPSDYTQTKKDKPIQQFQEDAQEARPAPATHPLPIVRKSSRPYPHSLLATPISIRHC